MENRFEKLPIQKCILDKKNNEKYCFISVADMEKCYDLLMELSK